MGRRGEWENVPDEELCTGEPIAEMAYASVNDTRKAIEAADAAFRSGCWSGLDAETRGAYLHRVADIQGFCMNQGEVCVSTSRLLLNDAIYEPFMEKLVNSVQTIRIGDCLDDNTQMGSLISPAHRETVQGFAARALAAAGKCLPKRRMTRTVSIRRRFLRMSRRIWKSSGKKSLGRCFP